MAGPLKQTYQGAFAAFGATNVDEEELPAEQPPVLPSETFVEYGPPLPTDDQLMEVATAKANEEREAGYPELKAYLRHVVPVCDRGHDMHIVKLKKEAEEAYPTESRMRQNAKHAA